MRLHEIIERAGSGEAPPDIIQGPLRALWLERSGDWTAAHDLAQEIGGVDGALIHAYLHRVEGDEANAAYWYQQAGRKQPAPGREGLDEEWEDLVRLYNGVAEDDERV